MSDATQEAGPLATTTTFMTTMTSSSLPVPAHTDGGAHGLLTLPPDVLFLIFSHLSTECLVLRVSRTCASLHDLLLPCEARRTDQPNARAAAVAVGAGATGKKKLGQATVPRRGGARARPFPRRAVRLRLGLMSNQFWRTRWEYATSADCRYLQCIQSHHHHPRIADDLISTTVKTIMEGKPASEKAENTTVHEAIPRLSLPFINCTVNVRPSSYKSLVDAYDVSSGVVAASLLRLHIRPLMLTVSAHEQVPGASDISAEDVFKAHLTERLLQQVEEKSIREFASPAATTQTTADADAEQKAKSEPELESAETRARPTTEAPSLAVQVAASTETALLCRKALFFLEQRADASTSAGSPSPSSQPYQTALVGLVDNCKVFSTITFCADTYPATKTYATPEELLVDARRLCATTQYALDCAYHQNFVAPHSLACLRGEVGDTTTVDTPDEPLVADIGTAPQQQGGNGQASGPVLSTREMGGSPFGPDLLTVNVMWTPQRKSELYSAVMEGFMEPPRGLGAFFPLTVSPAAAVVYEARCAAIASLHEQRRREAADALPIPDHFPVLPNAVVPMMASEESGAPGAAAVAAAAAAEALAPPSLGTLPTGQVWLEEPQPASSVAETRTGAGASATPTTTDATGSHPVVPLTSARLSTPVTFLFPSEHVFTYLYLLSHITFSDVKHHFWEPDEHKYAICSRLVSPTADSVECRFFYSYYVGSFPRLHMKMVFTHGDLPRTLVNRKLDTPQEPIPLRRRRERRDKVGRDGRGRGGSAEDDDDDTTNTSSDISGLDSSLTTSLDTSISLVEQDAPESISFTEETQLGEETMAPAVAAAVVGSMPDPAPAQPQSPLGSSAAGPGLSAVLHIREERAAVSLSFTTTGSDIVFHEEEEDEKDDVKDGGSPDVSVPRVVPSAQSMAQAAAAARAAAMDKNVGTRPADSQDIPGEASGVRGGLEHPEDEEDEEDEVLPRHDPNLFNDMQMLFVGGFGRVEVDVAPTVSKEGFLALRHALGLPDTFPIAWLWNVVMCATGLGARMFHRHLSGFLYQYHRTFTDAMESAFGAAACYGELHPWLRASVADTEAVAPSAAEGVGAARPAENEAVHNTASDSGSDASNRREQARVNRGGTPGGFSTPEATSTTTTTFDYLDAVNDPQRPGHRNPFVRPPFDSDDDSSEFNRMMNAEGNDSTDLQSYESGMWSDASGGS